MEDEPGAEAGQILNIASIAIMKPGGSAGVERTTGCTSSGSYEDSNVVDSVRDGLDIVAGEMTQDEEVSMGGFLMQIRPFYFPVLYRGCGQHQTEWDVAFDDCKQLLTCDSQSVGPASDFLVARGHRWLITARRKGRNAGLHVS